MWWYKVWYGSHGGEGYVEVCFGEVWCGRKFAEDRTGVIWYGKMGYGSLGQERFRLARLGWAGLHWNGSVWIGKLGIEMVGSQG